jgi:heme exporter protein D
MTLGPHFLFIIGAYGIAVLIIVMMIAWVAFDYRRQTRTIAELEARGVTRRSDRPGGTAP